MEVEEGEVKGEDLEERVETGLGRGVEKGERSGMNGVRGGKRATTSCMNISTASVDVGRFLQLLISQAARKLFICP